MTAGARVWRAHRDREIRSRDPQTVIVPRIDHHVGRRRHMTTHTGGAGALHLVVMMSRRIVLRRSMTRCAGGVAVGAQLSGVRVVTVAAGHTAGVHLTLQERAVVVHFVALLSVGVVQVSGEQRRPIVVEEWLTGFIAIGDLAAPRVTLRTSLDLAIAGAWM